MKNVKILFASTVVVSLFIALFIVNQGIADAEEKQDEKCHIVSLRGNIASSKTQQVISIDPQYTNVSLGSCVVWMNWIRGPEISTSFKEGKICADNTASSVGYRLTPDTGCFVTDFLKEGETSSLRFMQAGDYKYDIYVKGKTAPLVSGKITVK